MSLLRGKRYNLLKKSRGGTGANQHSKQKGQNVPSAPTARSLSKQYGVEERTIKRDGQLAAYVEKHPGKAEQIRNGTVKLAEVRKEVARN